MEQSELFTQIVQQFALLSTLLAGFAVAAVMQAIGSEDRGRLTNVSIISFCISSLAFIGSTILASISSTMYLRGVFGMVSEMQRNRALLGRFAIISVWLIPIGLLMLLSGITAMAFQRSKALGYGLLIPSLLIVLLVVILFRAAFAF